MKNFMKTIGGMFALLMLVQSANAQQSFNGLRLQDANGHVATISAPTGGFSANYNFRFPATVPAAGSILYSSDGAGQSGWLSPGASGQVLTFNAAGIPTWASIASLVSGGTAWDLTGNAIALAYNGIAGDYIGTSSAQPFVIGTTNTLTPQPIKFYTGNAEKMRLTSGGELGIGLTPTSGKLLHVNGTAGTSNVRLASLANATGTTGRIMFATDATGDLQTLAFPASAGQILSSSTGGALSWITPSAGTVTSVGLSMPSIFSVSNSPVTSSGTLTASLATQSANFVLAGPTSGGAAAPTFRALTAADLPSSTSSATGSPFYIKNIAGTASNVVLDLDASGAVSLTEVVMPYSGSIVAVSVASSKVCTAGTATFTVYVNGVAKGITSTLNNSAHPQYVWTTQAQGIDTFSAGDRISVKCTSSGFTPTGTDAIALVFAHLN